MKRIPRQWWSFGGFAVAGALMLLILAVASYGQEPTVDKTPSAASEDDNEVYRIGGDTIHGERPASTILDIVGPGLVFWAPESFLDRDFRSEIQRPVLKDSYEKEWGEPERPVPLFDE